MTEQATTTQELDQTKVSEEEPKSAKVSEESESKASETKETEKPELKYSEPDFLKAVEEETGKRAQSLKDKELKSIYAQMSERDKKITDLNRQLQTREDDKDLKAMFDADTEEQGEDKAKRTNEARTKFASRFREYQEKAEIVKQASEAIKEIDLDEETAHELGFDAPDIGGKIKAIGKYADYLGGVERHQIAIQEALKLVLPKDKGLSSEVDSIVKRLEEADTPREFDLILKTVQREYEGKAKPFKPDSGRSGGGGQNFDEMSPREKIEEGLRRAQKKK